jgi:hypothetical protein
MITGLESLIPTTIDVIGLGNNAVRTVLIELETVFQITVNLGISLVLLRKLAFCL